MRDAFPEGAAWLAALPSLITECERRWDVRVTEEPFDSSYSFVAPAVTAQGRDVVVKIAVPSPELRHEIKALRLYNGGAAVALLDADEEEGLFLLERVTPASKLSDVEDDEEATVTARMMRDLWQPLPAEHTFPNAADWAAGLRRLRRRFGGGTGPFDVRLAETAEALFKELLGSGDRPVLVHGDLHHFNIVSAVRRPWIAIDPKGLAAEPAYEVGALLRNPTPDRYLNPVTQRRRVEVLAGELGLDTQRIAGWGVAQAVLSAWWHYEDSSTAWESSMACAAALTPALA